MHQKQAPASLYNISDLGIISELGEEEAMRVSGGGAAKVFATTEDSGKYQASTGAYSDGFR
nr:hypothetical protein [Nostoc sp. ChiSLP03a]MDZ8213069.1 hypothetical protein [Nostoc sp. ChiSLP03a]